MANETVNRQINIFIESGNAQKTLDTLLKKQADLTTELTKTSDPKRIQALNDQLSKLAEPIDRATKKVSGELSPSFQEMSKTVNELGNRLKKMSTEDADYSKVLSQYKQAGSELDNIKQRLAFIKTGQDEVGGSFGEVFKHVAEYTGAYEIFNKLVSGIKSFFETSVEEADKAETAVSKLENSLQNVGRLDLLGTLSEQAEKFAAAYQRINPNDIKDVFTKLVDYGKLTQNQIVSLTDVVINYAAKQKVDLPTATDVFTKALEGSSKGLKTYGIDLTNAHSVSDRFNIVMTQMGDKVKGAETAFENTSQGIRGVWAESINRAKEAVGEFFNSLSGAEEQSQRMAATAKQEAESADKLVTEYQALASQTNLTAAQKERLKIIQADLVAMFGSSVLEVNKETGAYQLNIEATKDLIKQKLLLANDKAAEVAAKFSKAMDDQAESLAKVRAETDLVNAKQKELGVTFQQVYDMQNSGGGNQARKVGDSPGLRSLYDLGIQLKNTKQQYDLNSDAVKKYTQQLEELGFKASDVTKLFNPKTTDPNAVVGNGDPNANSQENSKAEEARKKALEEQQKFLDELAKFRRQYAAENQDEEAKELQKAQETRIALEKVAKTELDNALLAAGKNKKAIKAANDQYNTELLQAEEVYQIASAAIQDKYAQKRLDAFVKWSDNFDKANADYFATSLKASEAYLKSFEAMIDKGEADRLNKMISLLQSQMENSYGKQRLDIQNKILDAEEKREVDAAIQRGEDTTVIHQKYDAKRLKLEQDSMRDSIEMYLDWGKQVVGIFDAISNAKTQSENAELARDKTLNDRKISNLQNQLKEGLITQQEYNKKVDAITKEQDAKQKEIALRQFRRAQQMQVVQTLMNGAAAVVSTLAAKPGITDIISLAAFRAINIALVAATTAAEIATIASQKPPQLARGGRVHGPSHASGGVPAVNRRGQQVAEVEGGEGVTNRHTMADQKRYTVSGTPSAIISMLNGLHGGVQWESGATLAPSWSTQRPQPIAFSNVNTSLNQVRMFASGGIVGGQASGSQSSPPIAVAPPELIHVIVSMQGTIEDMRQTMADIKKTGIQAFVPITYLNDQQARYNAIVDDATFK